MGKVFKETVLALQNGEDYVHKLKPEHIFCYTMSDINEHSGHETEGIVSLEK